MNNLKNYQYVFYWGPEDYYKRAFKEILSWDNVTYIPGLPDSRNIFLRGIHRIHHSARINKIVKLPYRERWRRLYFKDKNRHERPLCFMFHGSYYWLKTVDYFAYLKKKYPESTCVFVLMDTVDSYIKYFKYKFDEGFDIQYLRNNFDYIVSYNQIDVQRYDFLYYPGIYSMPDHVPYIEKNHTDVFFVGRAKDRLEMILNVYELMVQHDISCDFYIIGVEKSKQKYADKIIYNKALTYQEVLEHVNAAECILEITQESALGFTLRTNEALAFDKKLLTNNQILFHTKYADSEKFLYFHQVEDIKVEHIKRKTASSFCYQDEYSPIQFINFIESLLKRNE